MRDYCTKAVKIALPRRFLQLDDAIIFNKIIMEAGVLGLAKPTPVTILISLNTKTSVKPHDKYYGIQSVFSMKMKSDYESPLADVRAEFLGRLWTDFGSALTLALNNPFVLLGTTELASDSEDSLLFFDDALLQDGKLESCPTGFSATAVRYDSQGIPAFAATPTLFTAILPKFSSACLPGLLDPLWRYEAIGIPRPGYGLPLIGVRLMNARRLDSKPYQSVQEKFLNLSTRLLLLES